MGQAGAWIIADPDQDALGLPSGYGEFDIPLILTSKFYNENGTVLSTVGEDKNYWGDVIEVVSRRRRATRNTKSVTAYYMLTVLERTTMAVPECRATKVSLPVPQRRCLEGLRPLFHPFRRPQHKTAIPGHRL